MDQIVFVFDLEQVVPLDYLVEAVEDNLIEARLNRVKQAVVRILTFSSDVGKMGASRMVLPSFGFRFYSSTEYFSLPPQLTGDWHDLSLSSWENLEDSLVDRFDVILAAAQRAKAGQSLSGRESPASAMCKVLEEVCALYSWDRPAIYSPVKKEKKEEAKLGNCVIIVTKLPEDLTEIDKFLGTGSKKKPTVRDVVDSLISKRVRNQFSGESDIALHILDTGEGVGEQKVESINLFNQALKEMRGGVLPVSSISTLFNTKMETNSICSTLVCTSRSTQSAPSSAVLQGHLAEIRLPNKLVDKSYVKEKITVGELSMGVEFNTCGIGMDGMESRGFIRNTFFKPEHKWAHTITVWSDRSPAFGAILHYLQDSGHCLLMENRNSIMAVMFYQTDTSAVICRMDKVESHFYHMLLSLDSHTPTIALTEEMDYLLRKIATLQFSPCKKPVFIPKQVSTNFDVSVLENWRLPDSPAPSVFNCLKAALSHQNSSYHKLMLGVRESYHTNSFADTEDGKFGEMDSATFVQDSVLEAKARAAADLIRKMGDQANGTDDLIDSLVALRNIVVTGTDDLVLAGYAEACVSVLLKQLDKVGICKTSLEEVVTTKLLLDVFTVAKLYSADPKMRVAQHKVQVLLRVEVHWLLVNQREQEQYEDSMLRHIRQISLHGGINVMTEFLSLVLTKCYIDRQPELLSLLYDELDQEPPRQLAIVPSSPSGSKPSSTVPPSNFGSAGPGSQGVMAHPPVFTMPASNKANYLTRTFRSRPKSFDTSLTRQIIIGIGRKERKNLKVVTTGRMITKSMLSAKKRLSPHNSPRKTKQTVKRNLTFDDGKHRSPVLPQKSPRKNLALTTPSKARKFTPNKLKLTPGKQHRVLCPETPPHRGARRKSDGNTSIGETPDKGDVVRTIASPILALRRKALFYSGGRSRNVQKFEDSYNASLIVGNVSSLDLNNSYSVRKESVGNNGQVNNRSFVLFPHLVNAKRKREDSVGGEDSGVMGTKSQVKKVKRRLNSFSDSFEPSVLCPPFTETSSQSSLKPVKSTCLIGTAHVLHHHPGQELDLSSIPGEIKTPNRTPRKNFQNIEDYSSPGKKVMFNMAPQPPTPKLGLAAKPILKTPVKITESSPGRQSLFLTPSRQNLGFKTSIKTPSKVAMKLSLTPKKEDPIQEPKSQISRSITPRQSPLTTHCSSRLTPGKSLARRDNGMLSSRDILIEMVKTPVKSPSSSLSNSPIIHSRRRCQSLRLLTKEQLEEGDLSVVTGLTESLRGPNLVMWLEELQTNIAVQSEQMEGLMMELLKLRWAHQEKSVVAAYTNFLVNLVSANTRYTKVVVTTLISNFKGGTESDSEVFKNTHAALKGLLAVSPVGARDEILDQMNFRFPSYKMPAYTQICHISAVVEMSGYVSGSREQVLCLLMEKLIKLDAHLSRDFIGDAYRIRDEEEGDLDNQVCALDLFMKLMFTYIHRETHVLEEFNHDKATPVVDIFLKIFSTHILPTFNIVHTQFLYLYLGSLSPAICSRFLLKNWRIFSNSNTPSVLRQTAMAYIASFLSRASFAPVTLVMSYLDRITNWTMTYIKSREYQSSGPNFVFTDLSSHGPFYSACQAIFYVFTFRHTELTKSKTRMKTLQRMSWQSLVTSFLNPLCVCQPSVVRNYSAIAKSYQLAYCNSIIMRNNRINLPVVRSLRQAGSKGNPMLLNCFFPFDPYMLEETRKYVEKIYRPYTGEIIDESDDKEYSDDVESEEDIDTPDSGLGKKKRGRIDSWRSSIGSCRRVRQDSDGCLNDLLMEDLVPASPGFH